MTGINTYNIHNILKFCVINNFISLPKFLPSYRTEYENFESYVDGDFQITFKFCNFNPLNNDCIILDNKYFLKKDYFYCEDSYKGAKFKFEITGFDSKNIDVKMSGNFLARMIIPGILMDPIINLKLMENGYCLIHGSCISKNNKAFLFSAQGGAGKTSIALYANTIHYNFMGDNFVILGNNRVISFLSPLNIFSFNLLPIVKNNLNCSKKVEFFLKQFLQKITKISIVTKINPHQVCKGTTYNNAILKKIFILLPFEQFSKSNITKQDSIKYMVNNMKMDMSWANKYFMFYGYVFPDSSFAKYWENYESTIKMNLNENVASFKVEVPKKFSKNTFDSINRVIEDEDY